VITFEQKPFTCGQIPGRRYFKIKQEWFALTINNKRYVLHRSAYKFKSSDDGNNIYPYLELETAVKKSRYLIRQWRHRKQK
jgi:hypothetical protein